MGRPGAGGRGRAAGRGERVDVRLLALNEQNIPFAISRGKRDNEIVVDWRYADAKWLDLMRLHGMSRGYRLVLRLDEGAHNVRSRCPVHTSVI